MLRRKAELQKEKAEEAASIMEALDERKKKLKETNKVEGMTDADKAKMLTQLETAYDAIDSAYKQEMLRQELKTNKILAARKQKLRTMEAIRKKDQDKRQDAAKDGMEKGVTKGLKGLFKKQQTLFIADDNDELHKKLRAWKLNKKQYDQEQLDEQVQEVTPDMDSNEIKTMILKLKLVQSNLKQIYAKKKKQAKKDKERKEKKRHRKRLGGENTLGSALRKPENDDRSAMGSRMKQNSAAGNYEDASAGDDVSAIGGQSQMSRSRSKRDKKKKRN